MSDTVDWGIDLGTTNSSLAIQRHDRVVLVSNSLGDGVTPSAVSVRNVAGRQVFEVGKKAKNRLSEDPGNVAQEFKQMMGEPDWVHKFQAGPAASAYELSAHVLSELVRSLAIHGELPPLRAAIVGVPAAFKNKQYDDTKKACKQAGIEYVELLPEPVAAALAFAHVSERSRSTLWLAYDLGGGTFDAALVRGEDGVFSVVDHEGDPQLGGKHLDNEIVMKLIYPHLPAAIQKELIPWKSFYWWKLKAEAEAAKCLLSIAPEAYVEARLGSHEVGIWLNQEDVNELQAKVFAKSLDLCRALLSRNGHKPSDLEKILMIGGPTKSKFLRDMVERGLPSSARGGPVGGLGVPIDCSVDPLTAVAQGAALYAAGRPIPKDLIKERIPDSAQALDVSIDLHFPKQVTETDALVTGAVQSARGGNASAASCSVVISRADREGKVSWQSPPISVSETGKFGQRLPLLEGENHFRIVVSDSSGRTLTSNREEFRIVQGIKTGQLTLPRNIGVADKFGATRWIFKKGDPLPGRQSDFFRTTIPLKKGKGGTALEIHLVEGTNKKAHLNELIYTLRLTADDEKVTTDVPEGADLEISLSIDESRQIEMKTTFVDCKIEVTTTIPYARIDSASLKASLEAAKDNFQLLKRVSGQDHELLDFVRLAEDKGWIAEIEVLLYYDNIEAAQQAKLRLREFLERMDPYQAKINDLLEWAQHEQFCDRNMDKGAEIVAGTDGLSTAWMAEFEELRTRYRDAAQAKDRATVESIAYIELPELFKKSEILRVRVGDGPNERGVAERLTGMERKGDIK